MLYGVVISLDSDGFLISEAGVFAGVLVREVHRVARELDAAGLFPLDEEGVPVA